MAVAETRRIRIVVDSSQAARAARQINRNLDSIRRSSISVNSALRTMLATFGLFSGVELARRFVVLGGSIQELTGRIKELESEVGNAPAVMDALFDAALATYTPLEGIVRLYARLRDSTKEVGTGQQEMLRVTKTVANTLRLWGVSAQEAQSVMTQFSQAMGAGNLAGEELRAILEGNRTLAKIFADEFEILTGQLKKYGKEGKLTVDRIVEAILNAEKDVEERAKKLGVPVTRALENVSTEFKRMLYATSPVFEVLSQAALLLADNLREVVKVVVILGGALAGLAVGKGIGILVAALAKLRAAMLAVGAASAVMGAAVGALPALIGAAVAAIVVNWGSLKVLVTEWDLVWQIITTKGERYLNNINIMILEATAEWSRSIADFFRGVRNAEMPTFPQLTPGFNLTDTVKGAVNDSWDWLADTAPGIADGIESAFDKASLLLEASRMPQRVAETVTAPVAEEMHKKLGETVGGAFDRYADAKMSKVAELKRANQGLIDSELELSEKFGEAAKAAADTGTTWNDLTQGMGDLKRLVADAGAASGKAAGGISRLKDELRGLLDTLFPVQAAVGEYTNNLMLLEKGLQAGMLSTSEMAEAQRRLKEQLMETMNPFQQQLENLQLESKLIGKTVAQVAVMKAEYEGAKRASELFAAGQAEMGYAVLDTTAQIKEQILANEQLEKRHFAIQRSARNMAHVMTDAWERMFEGGTNFMDLLNDISKSIVRMINKVLIMKPLENFFTQALSGASTTGGPFSSLMSTIFAGGTAAPSARGNVIDATGIMQFAMGGVLDAMGPVRQFANGGVVSQESYFTTAGNNRFIGSLAEGNKPEAILPLERDSEGKLGVKGGQTVNVSINITGVQDVSGFRAAQGQLEAETAAALSRASRRMGR